MTGSESLKEAAIMKKVFCLVLAFCVMLSFMALADVADGVFTGTGAGRNGDVKVAVTFEGAAITRVEVTEQA